MPSRGLIKSDVLKAGMSGEKESRESVLSTYLNDDDDDYLFENYEHL